MAFIADKNGFLHDIDRASPACDIEPSGIRYESAAEAQKAQARENAINQSLFDQELELNALTIQHFCSFCMPGKSWSDLQ